MTIQNNVRFGMIYGPFSDRPSTAVKNQILERTNQPGPLVRVMREQTAQNQQLNRTYYLIGGDKDTFELTHALHKGQSERLFDREDGLVLLEELFDRAINPDHILRD